MSESPAQFKLLVRTQCIAALVEAGFLRFRKDAVDWPIDDSFHVWVGLNTAVFSDRVEISPFVGVHVKPIEKLWTQLKVGEYATKYDRAIATYAVHLGQIAPNEPAFKFRRDSDLQSEAKRLAALYESSGLEFAKSISTYDALVPLLKERVEGLGAFPERFACCLYLMGRHGEARSFVQRFTDEHSRYFAGFAEPFLRLVEK